MAADTASVDTEQAKGNQPPPSREPPADGAAAASAAPQPGALGQQLLRARTGVGDTGDPLERSADQAADRVLRMPDPSRVAGAAAAPPAAPAPTPSAPTAPVPAPSPASATGSAEVRRSPDPAPPQKVPGTPTVPPATGSTAPGGVTGGTGPSTVTPAGPAPVVPAPVTPEGPRVETGTTAPDAEAPAPEGEAPARETPVVPPRMQEYLDASRGKGAPLPEAVRTDFEARYQRPFDDVRVHDDGGADDAARQVDALAFTRGNDIYFRSGTYDPTTEPGRHLLAHELAHVVQQRPGVNRKVVPGLGGAMIRRKAAAPAVPDDKKGPSWEGPAGKIDTSASPPTIQVAQLSFPRWKKEAKNLPAGPYKWRKEKRPPTPQLDNWKKGVREQTRTAVTARLQELDKSHASGTPYFVKSGKTEDRTKVDFYVGTENEVAEMVLVPTWTRGIGNYQRYDVDHKVDWQLTGGMTGENDFPNIWLFERKTNQSEGERQRTRIQAALDSFLDKAEPYLTGLPNRETVRKTYSISFDKVVFNSGDAATKNDYWEQEDMGTPAHVNKLEVLSKTERDRLRGTKDSLQIFGKEGGGRVKEVQLDPDGRPVKAWKKEVRGDQLFEVVRIDFTSLGDQGGSGKVGSVKGNAFTKSKKLNPRPFSVPLLGFPGLPFGAVLSKAGIAAEFDARGLSPVTMPELEFDPFDGFVGRGKITPSIDMLKRVDVDLVLTGAGVGIEAVITGDSLDLPGPFKVTGGMLSLYAGTDGIAVTGQLNFAIEKLAKGYLRAAAGTTSGTPQFELEGGLDFDAKMFSTAHLGLSYKNGEWGVSGELVTAPKAIKGIKSGRARVDVKAGTVTATGEFEPELKGLKKGTLGFRYDEATGMEITGEILIGEGIPGIRSGRLAATIKEGPDKHSLSGDVTIEPSVPGLTGNVTGKYDDGAFLVDADLGYEKDYAKGTLHVGVTNQSVGADGKPAGPPKPDGSLLVYGEGSVTLTLTPWLKGTVGLKLKPNGEVEVSGEVALPPTFDVFDEQKINKELLSAHVDIPIVGVSVLGQRIGIFATVGGSLSIDAGIGPGQLRDTAIRLTYNPARPEDTTVSGNATFAVPAHAALRLDVHGGLGVGIPVVSATAGLNVYGEIGVFGEASASTAVTWSPSAGVVLDASASIFVEPKFKFGIDAYVDVSADLWVKTIELYHETWKLAAFEYGSNLRFGLTLPVHYESGKPFVLGFDQIQWTYPHIEPKELVSGLVEQLVG